MKIETRRNKKALTCPWLRYNLVHDQHLDKHVLLIQPWVNRVKRACTGCLRTSITSRSPKLERACTGCVHATTAGDTILIGGNYIGTTPASSIFLANPIIVGLTQSFVFLECHVNALNVFYCNTNVPVLESVLSAPVHISTVHTSIVQPTHSHKKTLKSIFHSPLSSSASCVSTLKSRNQVSSQATTKDVMGST